MEIDFLGLNTAPKYKLHEQQSLENPFTDSAGGVEISLSLSTSSSLNLSELQKKKWEFADCSYNHENHYMMEKPNPLLVARPVYGHSGGGGGGGFLYDLNVAATPNLIRNMSQLPDENSLYIHGNAITAVSTRGHTPTVAMARRATLARFLEKRLHRMNQAKASRLMGKSLSQL